MTRNVFPSCGIAMAKRFFLLNFKFIHMLICLIIKDCTDGDDEPGRDICG